MTAPKGHPVHSFFAAANVPLRLSQRPYLRPRARRTRARAARANSYSASRKPWFYRHFCDTRKSSHEFRQCKSSVRGVASARMNFGERPPQPAPPTHKIKRSHCYFFPAVVIGLQCGSIRDCTVPISPSTQARRAAMAKKRKAKAKTAKKTTKRRKKK